MPKPLPLSDFRARRIVLNRSDFAYAPGRAKRPSDLISTTIWRSIVTLPDDVAVRTSNHHGQHLALLQTFWAEWIGIVGQKRDTAQGPMLDAADDFQAALYNSLCGFYRLSFAALRSALELMAIAAHAQSSGATNLIQGWRAGTMKAGLGKACDGLITLTKPTQAGTILFAQKTPTAPGGVVRVLFEALSHYSHSRPGYTDGDLRESNGPIYVRGAFLHSVNLHIETAALCVLFVKIARPRFVCPDKLKAVLFKSNHIITPETIKAWEQIFATP